MCSELTIRTRTQPETHYSEPVTLLDFITQYIHNIINIIRYIIPRRQRARTLMRADTLRTALELFLKYIILYIVLVLDL